MGTKPANRYELVTCGLQGHVLVGTDAAEVTDADAAVVRELGGMRWYRCLRCDGWLPRPAPTDPSRPRVPPKEEIAIPFRGPLLRDRYVLRLIAVDRALHVVLLGSLAVLIFFFAGDHSALQRDYNQVVEAFGGPTRAHPFLGRFRHWFALSNVHLYAVATVVVAYALLEAVEMVGLWLGRRWAEYLTFVATALFIPLEVYELTSSVSVLKLVTLVLNVAIAAYLLWAKRLFGVRGGRQSEEERRRKAMSWDALEAAVSPAAQVPTPGGIPADGSGPAPA